MYWSVEVLRNANTIYNYFASDCVICEHPSLQHKIEPANEAITKKKEQFSAEWTLIVDHFVKSAQERVQSYSTAKALLTRSAEETSQTVRQFFAALKQILQEREVLLLRDIDEKFAGYYEKYTSQSDELELYLNQIQQSTVEFRQDIESSNAHWLTREKMWRDEVAKWKQAMMPSFAMMILCCYLNPGLLKMAQEEGHIVWKNFSETVSPEPQPNSLPSTTSNPPVFEFGVSSMSVQPTNANVQPPSQIFSIGSAPNDKKKYK